MPVPIRTGAAKVDSAGFADATPTLVTVGQFSEGIDVDGFTFRFVSFFAGTGRCLSRRISLRVGAR